MWDVLRWHDGTLTIASGASVGFALLVVIAAPGAGLAGNSVLPQLRRSRCQMLRASFPFVSS
jgi:hypothetical protein